MAIVAGVMVIGIGAADATLINIGTASYDSDGNGTAENYNLLYDNDQSLIWLDYVRGGETRTTGASSIGGDTWFNQIAWASSLNMSGVITYNLNNAVTVNWTNEWRLPSAGDNPQNGDARQGDWAYQTEMGHLYYSELGNPAGGYGDESYYQFGAFTNLIPSVFWLSTMFVPNLEWGQTEGAWAFNFSSGGQGAGSYSNDYRAIAVRSGVLTFATPPDPGPAPVPEPATLLLFGTGIAGLAGIRLRIKK